jgi:hypothetical protein
MFSFCKIFKLFSSFEFDENFLYVHFFLKCLLVFIFLVQKLIFEIWGYTLIIQFIYEKFLIDEYSTILILEPSLEPTYRWTSSFWPLKEYLILINRYITLYSDFGAQIQCFGSEGLFSPFSPLTVCIFFIYIKCLIDGYITRPCPEGLFSLFLTPKSKFSCFV